MDEGKSIEFCGFLNVFDLTQLNNSMLRCSLQGSSKIVKNSDSISVTFVCTGWANPWPPFRLSPGLGLWSCDCQVLVQL